MQSYTAPTEVVSSQRASLPVLRILDPLGVRVMGTLVGTVALDSLYILLGVHHQLRVNLIPYVVIYGTVKVPYLAIH